MSSDAVQETNKEESLLVSREASKRIPYLQATPEQKAIIGKYVTKNGIVDSIRHFQNFLTDTLREDGAWLEKCFPARATNKKGSGSADVAITA